MAVLLKTFPKEISSYLCDDQKKWGGGGRGAFPFTRSLVVVIVVIERDRLFGKLYRQRELLWKIVHLKDHGD